MKKGFTLIELVLTIVIVGIIALVTAQVLMRGVDAYALIVNRRDALQHARVGMDRMVSELILTTWLDISWYEDKRIVFRDSLGNWTSFNQSTTSGTTDLFRGSDFLAGQIGLLDFDFYKADNSQAFVTGEMRRMSIELTVQTIGGFGSVPLRTEVFPRSFMYLNFK